MRENFRSRTRASVCTSSVFASPGTPTIRLLPPTNSVSSTSDDHLVLADDRLAELGDDLLAADLHPVRQRDVVRRFEVDAYREPVGSKEPPGRDEVE